MLLTRHLILDGQSPLFKGLRGSEGVETVERIIRTVVTLTEMHLISCSPNPHVIIYQPRTKPETDWGISGVALIETSHVSLHTWRATGLFSFDLFSCKPFDPAIIESYLVSQCRCEITHRQMPYREPR